MRRYASLFHRPSARSAGFSFLEIMLVVLIIGIMTAIVGPRIIGRSEKAKITAAKQQIANFRTALQMFEMTTGRFPTTEEGLEALMTRPSSVSETDWEKAIDEVPKDPWKNAYIYQCPGEDGRDFDIVSKGPDPNDPADDITSFPKESNSD